MGKENENHDNFSFKNSI